MKIDEDNYKVRIPRSCESERAENLTNRVLTLENIQYALTRVVIGGLGHTSQTVDLGHGIAFLARDSNTRINSRVLDPFQDQYEYLLNSEEDLKDNNFVEEIQQHYLGAMDKVCCYCGSLHFAQEKNIARSYKECCRYGKMKMQERRPYQPYLTLSVFGKKI